LAQPVNYPAIDINIDRQRAAQMGVTVSDISRSLIASTSSSRYTEKNVWIDPNTNQSYNVQVEIPENQMKSINDIEEIPMLSNSSRTVLSDVADIKLDTTYGENDNMGTLPFLSVTANLNQKDLGSATEDVDAAIKSIKDLPRGLTIETKGLSEVLSVHSEQFANRIDHSNYRNISYAGCKFSILQSIICSTVYNTRCYTGISDHTDLYRVNIKPAIIHGNNYVGRSFHCKCRIVDHECRTPAPAQCECFA
jgi:hypothetical protein